jgi:hypothetical protein
MISADTVTHTWQQMSAMPGDQALQLVQRMSNEQPIIFVYLLEVNRHRCLNEREGQLCFYVGLVVWQIMMRSPKRMRKVTQVKLDQAKQVNEEFLGLLAIDTQADLFSATKMISENYPEPEVLGCIMKLLMDDADYDPDDPPISDANRGLAFLHLKIILDAFMGSTD